LNGRDVVESLVDGAAGVAGDDVSVLAQAQVIAAQAETRVKVIDAEHVILDHA
jgi:hypothetical protein